MSIIYFFFFAGEKLPAEIQRIMYHDYASISTPGLWQIFN
jgi:hypothetical protein